MHTPRYLSQYAEKRLAFAEDDDPLLSPREFQRRLCAGLTMESAWFWFPQQQRRRPAGGQLPRYQNATFLFRSASCVREPWDPRFGGVGKKLAERYGRQRGTPSGRSWLWWWWRQRELSAWDPAADSRSTSGSMLPVFALAAVACCALWVRRRQQRGRSNPSSLVWD